MLQSPQAVLQLNCQALTSLSTFFPQSGKFHEVDEYALEIPNHFSLSTQIEEVEDGGGGS